MKNYDTIISDIRFVNKKSRKENVLMIANNVLHSNPTYGTLNKTSNPVPSKQYVSQQNRSTAAWPSAASPLATSRAPALPAPMLHTPSAARGSAATTTSVQPTPAPPKEEAKPEKERSWFDKGVDWFGKTVGGGVESLIKGGTELVAGATQVISNGAGAVAGIFNEDLGESIKSIGTGISGGIRVGGNAIASIGGDMVYGALAGDSIEDPNAAQIAGMIGIGQIPILGTLADIRDVAGGVISGDMGRTALAVAGALPAGDIIKYGGDLIKPLGKGLTEALPNAGKAIGNFASNMPGNKMVPALAGAGGGGGPLDFLTTMFAKNGDEGANALKHGVGGSADLTSAAAKNTDNVPTAFKQTVFESTPEARIKKTPAPSNKNVEFTNKELRGNSLCVPKESNKELKEILEKSGVSGIEYKNGVPDFSPTSMAELEIQNMRGGRGIAGKLARDSNFSKANKNLVEQIKQSPELASKYGFTEGQKITSAGIEDYMKNNKMTWHELNDMKTMQMVPSQVNNQFKHLGGIGEINIRNDRINLAQKTAKQTIKQINGNNNTQ